MLEAMTNPTIFPKSLLILSIDFLLRLEASGWGISTNCSRMKKRDPTFP